jgi:hypothetical protein
VRHCLHCSASVTLHEGQIGSPNDPGTLISGGVAFVAFKFFGVLGGIAALCVSGALSSLTNAFAMKYRCGMCGREPDPRVLSNDDRTYFRNRRVRSVAIAAGLLAGAIASGVAWIALAVTAARLEE